MTRWRKFWIIFLSFLPFGAGAVAPLVIGLIAGGISIAGFSIYRSMSPVNMQDALSFFSSCWSCGIFNDIMLAMSDILPKIYSAIGEFCVPMAFALTAVYFGWEILKGYIGVGKQPDAWSISGQFGTHLVKLALVVALFLFPLPRFITNVAIEPIFNVGLSLGHAVDGKFAKGTASEHSFESCLVATAVMDPSSAELAAKGGLSPEALAKGGAFSPKLRHNMTCQLGQVHQMTGLGLTAGWTIMNMAFNGEYMHKLIIPIFPNVAMFLAGMLVTVLFFFALIPVPLYFLLTFIRLSMNLVMLPLMLLGWLFEGWQIFPQGNKPKIIIDQVVQDSLGIAMVGIFTAFSVLFLNAAFGKWGGASVLQTALETNDSHYLIDGLMMNNGSLITILMLGIFLAMFMNSIPALTQALFGEVKIPEDYYKKARDDLKKISGNVTDWWKKVSKANKGESAGASESGNANKTTN
ncbi:MAG: hypothetical protein FWF97_01120 [Alphaproteobacteria bacterium]|nr:hypothetical protein [Alphaproteobacteria bacterium]